MTEESLQTAKRSRLSMGMRLGQLPWRGFAWAWSAFIVLICLAPHNPGPPSAFPLDKLAHFLLFAAFGGLWLRACPRRLVWIAIAGTALGLAIEILQSSLGWGRMGDGADLLADCVGLFFGLGLAARFGNNRGPGEG